MENFIKKFSNVPNNFTKNFFDFNDNMNLDDFFINLNTASKWLEQSMDYLKETLKSKFEENYDYIKKNSSDNKETIFITSNCFKEVCILTATSRSKEIRKYFISVEKLIKNYYEYSNDKKENFSNIIPSEKKIVYILRDSPEKINNTSNNKEEELYDDYLWIFNYVYIFIMFFYLFTLLRRYFN